jgi:hypothetical protein
MGTQVVLDSTNLDAIIKDATGEGLTAPELPMNSGVQTTVQDALDTAAQILKDVGSEEPAYEGEDEHGLTFAERQELLQGLTEEQRKIITDRLRKSVGKKHRELKSAEEFAAEQYNTRRLAEAKALELEQQLKALQAPQVETPKEAVKPERQNFKSDDEYRDALIDWSVQQRLKAEKQKEAQVAAEKRQAEILSAAQARIAHALEVVPDFKEVTEAVDWPTPPVVAGYMQESEMFAEIGYYLAKNPEARAKLDSLSPARQLVEIGKIESKLQPFASQAKANGHDSDKSSKVEETSTALKPSPETGVSPSTRASAPVIRPLSSQGASQVEKPESEMSAKEALMAYQKRKHVNLTRRQRH